MQPHTHTPRHSTRATHNNTASLTSAAPGVARRSPPAILATTHHLESAGRGAGRGGGWAQGEPWPATHKHGHPQRPAPQPPLPAPHTATTHSHRTCSKALMTVCIVHGGDSKGARCLGCATAHTHTNTTQPRPGPAHLHGSQAACQRRLVAGALAQEQQSHLSIPPVVTGINGGRGGETGRGGEGEYTARTHKHTTRKPPTMARGAPHPRTPPQSSQGGSSPRDSTHKISVLRGYGGHVCMGEGAGAGRHRHTGSRGGGMQLPGATHTLCMGTPHPRPHAPTPTGTTAPQRRTLYV